MQNYLNPSPTITKYIAQKCNSGTGWRGGEIVLPIINFTPIKSFPLLQYSEVKKIN